MRVALILGFAGALMSPLALADGYWAGESSRLAYPLEAALDRTVPMDACWKIRISESLKGKMVFGSPAGMPWRDSLAKLAQDNRVRITVDDAECVVVVTTLDAPAPATEPAKAAAVSGEIPAATGATAPSSATEVVMPAPAEEVAGTPAEVAEKSFHLVKGSSLRGQVSDWAKSVGWEVIWELPYDYPVAVSATFNGDLFTAVEALVRSYERVGEMHDVEWVFNNGNQVVAVRPIDRFTTADRVARKNNGN